VDHEMVLVSSVAADKSHTIEQDAIFGGKTQFIHHCTAQL